MSVTYALRDDLVLTTRDGATFLTDLREGEVYEMNESAALILEALRRGDTPEHAVETLREKYPEVAPEELRGDVSALVAQLRAQGFLLERQARTSA